MKVRSLTVAAAAAGAAAVLAATAVSVPAHAVTTVKATKAIVFIEENHSLTQARAGMPYLVGLSAKYSYASHYSGVAHPSEPNYIAIAGGSTFGIHDDKPPSANAPKVGNAKDVFDQAIAAGKTAKSYNESMSGTCSTSGTVKHNAWPFFNAGHANCVKFDVGATSLVADAKANKLSTVNVVAPNQANDAHDGTLGAADNWLKARLPTLLASTDFTSGRLAIIVTFDEGTATAPNDNVFTVVMHAGSAHKVVTSALNHYSLSGYLSQVSGSAPLLNAGSAPSFRNAFGL